jgi:hypothetical protein
MFTITSRHAVKVWMRPQCYCYCSLSICFAMRNLDPGYGVVQSRVCCPTSSEPSLWDHATHGFWGTGYRPKRVWYSFNLNIKCVLWNIHINENIHPVFCIWLTHAYYVRTRRRFVLRRLMSEELGLAVGALWFYAWSLCEERRKNVRNINWLPYN